MLKKLKKFLPLLPFLYYFVRWIFREGPSFLYKFIEIGMNDISTDIYASPCPGCLKIPVYNDRDVIYFAQLHVGKSETFRVILDTRSYELWLPGADCTSCPRNKRYLCEASKTCVMTNQPYSMITDEGYWGHEMVGLTPDVQVNHSLLWINQKMDGYYKNVDGSIGLNNMKYNEDFIDLAYRDNYIKDKVFSFYFDHNSDIWSFTNSSYMTIGYIPEEKVNKLTWIPVNRQRWATKVYSIKVGNKTMDPMEIMYEREVIFDSGSAHLRLAPAMVNELKNQLKALDQRRGRYRCDAEYLMNYPNMTVDVKNMTIILNAYSYLYFGQPMNILGQNYCELLVKESTTIVLGVSFFRNNFMAFSKRNQTIGIYQEERPIVLSTELTKATQASLVFLVFLIIVIVALLIENVVDWVKKKVIKEPLNQGQENFDTMTA